MSFFFRDLCETVISWKDLWLLMGDFNEIMHYGEKFGGKHYINYRFFLEYFTHAVGSIDLGYMGKRFTWENRQEGVAYIKERLDKFLSNEDWLNIYLDATVEHLGTEVSNHTPILINTEGGKGGTGKRPFRFIAA